jgi:hypothetical protein
MANLEKRDAFKAIDGEYAVDWDVAISLCKTLDHEDNYSDGELPFSAAPCIRLLGIYGVLAKKASSCPELQKLAVVVWPPQVFFCPSLDELDGVFVEPYDKNKHGKNCFVLHKECNIWDFTSAHALRDGWEFNASMVSAGGDL